MRPRDPNTVRLTAALATLLLAAVLLAAMLANAVGNSISQVTGRPPPATATTLGGPVPTGRGPSGFTSITAPGPVQVLVQAVACTGYAGAGYTVRYLITNTSRPRDGAVTAAIDDSPPVVLQAGLHLAADSRIQLSGLVVGGGDSIAVTWTTTDGVRVASFPLEVPTCPTDPADLREAAQVTTSTLP